MVAFHSPLLTLVNGTIKLLLSIVRPCASSTQGNTTHQLFPVLSHLSHSSQATPITLRSLLIILLELIHGHPLFSSLRLVSSSWLVVGYVCPPAFEVDPTIEAFIIF